MPRPCVSTRDIRASTPAGAAAIAILLSKAEPVFDLEAAAASGEDTDAVHDMRVASRRLREAMATLAPAYRKRTIEPQLALIKQVTRTLGPVRDADVFIDTFRRLLTRSTPDAERKAVAYLIGRRQGERVSDLRRMRRRLRALRLPGRRRRFEKALASVKDGGAAQRPFADLARDVLVTRLDAVYSHLPAALTASHSEEQHAMRIAVKHLRYSVETLSPCFSQRGGAIRETLVAFQDVLGELHDHDVFIEHVRSIPRDEARAAGVPAVGLKAVERHLTAERATLFARFERLAREHDEASVRAEVLGGLIRPRVPRPGSI